MLRLAVAPEEWAKVLSLLQDCFAYMDGRIDPPSSLTRWSAETMVEEAAQGFAIIGKETTDVVACAFARPDRDALYLSKIAIAASHRGKGILHRIIDLASDEALRRGLIALTLQTRIELTQNQAAFGALGFAEIARTAHDGYDRPTSVTMRKLI